MKTVYLFRHGEPEKRPELRTEQVPLSEKGKQKATERICRMNLETDLSVWSSVYRRAAETAKLFGNSVILDERLGERKIGNPAGFTKEIWMNQYTDEFLSDYGGESFHDVRLRMTQVIDQILAGINENDAVIIVSHAAAICAYLQQFCTIQVTDADTKRRKIFFDGRVVYDGTIRMLSCFKLDYEESLVNLTVFE